MSPAHASTLAVGTSSALSYRFETIRFSFKEKHRCISTRDALAIANSCCAVGDCWNNGGRAGSCVSFTCPHECVRIIDSTIIQMTVKEWQVLGLGTLRRDNTRLAVPKSFFCTAFYSPNTKIRRERIDPGRQSQPFTPGNPPSVDLAVFLVLVKTTSPA
jgi:hypothetical protein